MTLCPHCNKELDDAKGYNIDVNNDLEEHYCFNCERAIRIKK